jgi:hypothetical protein
VGKLLRTIGFVIATAAVVFGVWIQFSHLYGGDKYGRMIIALTALTPVAAGLILVAAGHALALYEDAKGRASN